MRSAISLGLGILLAATPGVYAQQQAKPGTAPAAKPGQAPAKPAVPAAQAAAQPTAQGAAKQTASGPAKSAEAAAKRPARGPAKAAAKPAAMPVAKAKAPAKPPVPRVEKTAASSTSTAPVESEIKTARRDPFESLVSRQQAAASALSHLPPGKPGLQISTLRLDGVVKAPNGMIAVVSNPQARTYFLREGDHLYDGTVEKISMDGVSFHEEGKDAFGKPVERQVNKRIYSSPGEQQ